MAAEKKKILFIHHGKTMGGAPTSMLNIIRNLDKKQFDPKILFIFKNPDICSICDKENIHYRVLKSFFFRKIYCLNVYSAAKELSWTYQLRIYPFIRNIVSWLLVGFYYSKKIIKAESPDIIHFNSAFLTDWLWGVRGMNAKKIVHVREPLSNGRNGIKRNFYRFILRRYTDRIFAISNDNKQRLDIPEKTQVVYNFVQVPSFNTRRQNKPVVNAIYFGGDSKIKGFDLLEKARHFLDPGVNILVAGHFLNPERIPNYPNMKYIGIIENVYESLRESDILIFPSIVPHFAKPVIEAGMCKLPVIVSDVKGMEEIVKLHYNGILFPVGDVHALAEAINLLASSSTLREEYGHNNFKMVKDKFSVEVNLRIIQKEYLR